MPPPSGPDIGLRRQMLDGKWPQLSGQAPDDGKVTAPMLRPECTLPRGGKVKLQKWDIFMHDTLS